MAAGTIQREPFVWSSESFENVSRCGKQKNHSVRSSTNSLGELMLGIISTQEAVFDEIAHGLAMGTLRDFELGIEILEFELGRANSAAHDKLSQHIANISTELFESASLEISRGD